MIQEGTQRLQQQAQQIAGLMAALDDRAEDRRLKGRELDIKSYEAETERLQLQQPTFVRSPPAGVAGAA
jgi:hypothetical protein